MRGSRNFCQRGSNSVKIFVSWWGRERIQIPLKAGHQWAFRWRTHDGPTLNAVMVAFWFFRGSGPVLLTKYIFVIFAHVNDSFERTTLVFLNKDSLKIGQTHPLWSSLGSTVSDVRKCFSFRCQIKESQSVESWREPIYSRRLNTSPVDW